MPSDADRARGWLSASLPAGNPAHPKHKALVTSLAALLRSVREEALEETAVLARKEGE